MKSLATNLFALQDLERGPSSPEADERIEALRKTLPESLLTQFDRWMARRRKAVAVVRNGVCSECHIQVAVGTLGALAFSEEIQRCGSCGRFLYLPEDEPVYSPLPSTSAKPTPRRRKTTTHAG